MSLKKLNQENNQMANCLNFPQDLQDITLINTEIQEQSQQQLNKSYIYDHPFQDNQQVQAPQQNQNNQSQKQLRTSQQLQSYEAQSNNNQKKIKQNQVGIIGGIPDNTLDISKQAKLSVNQKRQKMREQMNQKQKYPRPIIPENNEENMNLGGSYQKFLYYMGECLGTLRVMCPCLFCIKYPFKQVNQGQQGIFQRFGKYIKTVGPGLHQINPFTDKLIVYPMKQITYDMAKKNCITKDNIQVKVDGQVFFRFVEPRYSHYYCQNVLKCVIQLAYTTVRTIVGHFVLQDIFEKRDEITQAIQTFLSDHSWEWGVSIASVIIKEVTPTKDVQDTLNVAAKERRLAESKIISAKTDVQSAKLMREAADILDSDSAMQIRYLETVKKLSTSSKVILLGEDDQDY